MAFLVAISVGFAVICLLNERVDYATYSLVLATFLLTIKRESEQ